MQNKTNNTLIGNSSVLKEVNRVRIMNYLRTHGPLSRAQLSRNTGLDAKTVTNICNTLLSDNLIVPQSITAVPRGRPPEALFINNDAVFSIGIGCGIEHVSGVIIDLDGNVRTRIRKDYIVPGNKDFMLKEIEKVIAELLDTADPEIRRKINGIGLSVPGLVDKDAGIALQSANIEDFKNVPIVDIIQNKFPFNVNLENICRTMTLAEMWFNNRTSNSFLCIVLGYGVGMGIMENGILHRGTNDRSGEIGHTIVQPGGKKCRCGRRGCLETVASGKALAEMARNAGIIQSGTEKATVKAIYESAKAGNAEAQQMLKQAGESIGIAISNVLDILDPQEVILNGELVNAGNMLIDPLEEIVLQHSRNFSDLSYEIKVSEIGVDADALGAAVLPLRGYFEFENIRL